MFEKNDLTPLKKFQGFFLIKSKNSFFFLIDVKEALIFFLNNHKDRIIPLNKFKILIGVLAVTCKSLFVNEILHLVISFLVFISEINTKVEISKEEFLKVVTALKVILFDHENHYMIRHKFITKVIIDLFFPTTSDLQKLHLKIGTFLELAPNSTRKYEEICYHLFLSNSLFKLKETISSIIPFLFLFNAFSKYDLFFYWRKLNKKKFDPSIEYNNALEAYCLKFYLSPEEMFNIVIQISRFLKEFSEFENHLTPDFRHPFIRYCPELAEIFFKDEGVKLEMINVNFSDRKPNILNKYETLNVDVPVNRQLLRSHYMDIVINEIRQTKIDRSEENMTMSEFIFTPHTPLLVNNEKSSKNLRYFIIINSFSI